MHKSLTISSTALGLELAAAATCTAHVKNGYQICTGFGLQLMKKKIKKMQLLDNLIMNRGYHIARRILVIYHMFTYTSTIKCCMAHYSIAG